MSYRLRRFGRNQFDHLLPLYFGPAWFSWCTRRAQAKARFIFLLCAQCVVDREPGFGARTESRHVWHSSVLAESLQAR